MKQATVIGMSMIICAILFLMAMSFGLDINHLNGLGIALISPLIAIGFAGGVRNIT